MGSRLASVILSNLSDMGFSTKDCWELCGWSRCIFLPRDEEFFPIPVVGGSDLGPVVFPIPCSFPFVSLVGCFSFGIFSVCLCSKF